MAESNVTPLFLINQHFALARQLLKILHLNFQPVQIRAGETKWCIRPSEPLTVVLVTLVCGIGETNLCSR